MYIVFPNESINSPSGEMVGTKNESGVICVLQVVNPSQSKTLCNQIGVTVLGYWCGLDFVSFAGLPRERYSKLVLFRRPGIEVPEVHSAADEEIVLVLCNLTNPCSYLSSSPLTLQMPSSVVELDNTQPRTLLSLSMPMYDSKSHTEMILQSVNSSKKLLSEINAFLHPRRHAMISYCLFILNFMLKLPTTGLGILVHISDILARFSKHGIFQLKVFTFLSSLPVFLIQWSLRLSQVRFLGKNTVDPQSTKSTKHPSSSRSDSHLKRLDEKRRVFIIKGNIILGIILDVIIGILVVYLISSSTLIEEIVNNIVLYTNNAAQLLTQLINWLMGVPGGLKLNKTLTHFLGNFFLYHIYLWQTYLRVIQPYLQPVLWMCIMSGCLGMTFLISMASDVFSLLTLHIYFFYVYAARLYSLQIYGILSLARLFTGKKWSVLRNRVDSLPYDVDRLFIGTLLFTVLLFLFPTTALFYVVFTTLRLLVLVIKSLLSGTTYLLNKQPLFGLLLLMLTPSMLSGGLKIGIIDLPSSNKYKTSSNLHPHLPSKVQSLCIKLFNKPLSVMQLVDWSIPSDHVSSDSQDTWCLFVKKLVCGHLIYPWIERN